MRRIVIMDQAGSARNPGFGFWKCYWEISKSQVEQGFFHFLPNFWHIWWFFNEFLADSRYPEIRFRVPDPSLTGRIYSDRFGLPCFGKLQCHQIRENWRKLGYRVGSGFEYPKTHHYIACTIVIVSFLFRPEFLQFFFVDDLANAETCFISLLNDVFFYHNFRSL